MAPYLFLLAEEAFNAKIWQAQQHGFIQKVKLLYIVSQQFTIQYVNNTSFIIKIEEFFVLNLIKILDIFNKTTRLIINWSKFDATRLKRKAFFHLRYKCINGYGLKKATLWRS